MKSKDRVLKVLPDAVSYKVKITDRLTHWHINSGGVCYGSQPRENWAWAEAVRILQSENRL